MTDAVAAMVASGAAVLQLSIPAVDEAHLLVRSRRHHLIARRVLDSGTWWLRLGGVGAWRATRTTRYLWNGGPTIDLDLGVPSWPLPRRSFGVLERLLWERSTPGDGGGRMADPVGTYAFAAVQAARPGAARRRWLETLHAFPDREAVVTEASDLAERAGVASALRWARRAAAGAAEGALASIVDATVGFRYWRVVVPAVLHIPSARFRSVMLGSPRIGHTPTRTRFAGVEIDGGPGVFVPRSMSEDLVHLVEHASPPRGSVVVEVGTGSGGVALALASLRPDLEIHATDTSAEAIRWARRNGRRLGIDNVRFARGSLLEPVPERLAGSVDTIVSSVPYVPPGRWGARDRYGSIEGPGEDGLDLLRLLAGSARAVLRPGGRLVLQLGREQWPAFSEELARLGYVAGDASGESPSDVVAWAELGPEGS